MRVSTNLSSVNAQRNLAVSQRRLSKSFAEMSSGSRINVAADDAAGLAISEKLKSGIRSARQANRNANDGISMVQIAEGGLQEVSNILVRLREHGIRAASETIGGVERHFIDKEVQQLKTEIDRIANTTAFGKIKLLDGSTEDLDFHVGIYSNPEENRITYSSKENSTSMESLGMADMNFWDVDSSRASLDMIDGAQNRINGIRASLGALQNRLVSTVNNLGVFEENMSAANSRIRDADVANASSEAVRNQIIQQAGTSALAQANGNQGLALRLIG